jgi:TonB-dependent starch-binding outer membrane protein SusC
MRLSRKIKNIRSCCIMQIIFLTLPMVLFAQNRTVQGTVTSSSGETLVGVSVIVKGATNRGTITDLNGAFSIKAEKNEVVTISYIGFKSQDVVVSENLIKIVLEDNFVGLNDVVVVGYGSVKKSDLTGSVGTIKTDNLKSIPANSIDGLLQGRAAGLQVINSSQNPGAEAVVRIRGGSSLRASNSPLLVVDGFPIGEAGNLKQINPADIVSVEVLKDASASAIYGSRGANGVIMITTKNAKKGTSSISIKHQTTVSQFSSNFIQFSDPALMAELDNEAKNNGGYTPLYIGANSSTGIYYPTIKEIQDGTWKYNTDWTKVVFRDLPVSNNTSVSINSATDKTSFNVSGNYFDQKGIYINDNYNKKIVSLNIKHKVSEKFDANAMVNISKDSRNNNGDLAYWRNPLWPIYNEDGTYYQTSTSDYENPMALTNLRLNTTSGTDLIASLGGTYEIVKGLKIRSQVNYKYGTSIQDVYNPPIYTSDGTNNNGAGYINNWFGENIVSDTYLTYDKTIGKHKISAMAGHSYENYLERKSNLSSFDYSNTALQNEKMDGGNAQKNELSNTLLKTNLLSFMGRLNYTYDEKYLFTSTFRADGSSKFGANNRWANFPSAAVSWKAHNEDFIKDLGIFDELKVRGSYGISGNQGISAYQTLSQYGTATYYANNQWNTAIGPGYITGYYGTGSRYRYWGGIANEDLKWETTSQYDFGLDLAFFQRKLRLTIDYYYKHTYGLLRERYLTLTSGYDKMWVNDGEIGNKGFEVTVDADIIKTKDWDFSGTFIYSMNRNKVLSLGNSVSSGLITDYNGLQYEYTGTGVDPFRETSPNILAVGQPVDVFYGYRVNGIIQSDAEGLAAGMDKSSKESTAGEFKYMDTNKDGQFNTDDRVVIGDPNPDFTASLNLSLKYKQFDVGIFLNGVFGNDILFTNMYNSPQFTPLRWTVNNPTNEYPSLREGRLYYTSDWFIKDGSFIRIQNINVGYTVNTSKLKGIKGLHIYLNTDNIFTFTKFKGYDPEVGTDGRYYGGYPRLRNWTVGLDLTF